MISYLQIENLTKSYGDLMLFENISMGVAKDQKVALIAKNGTGKTSLLKIIAGLDTADSGLVTFRNDLVVTYLDQEPHFDDSQQVMEHIFRSSGTVQQAVKNYERAMRSNNHELQEQAISEMDRLNAWDYEVRIKQILTQLDITDFEQPLGQLSGGQRKRVALAHALITDPDFLILDEPTNHLDTNMIEWLEEYLQKTKATLLMVTHDRYFLDRVCNEIIEMEDNSIYTYRGNYSYYLEKRAERLEQAQAGIDKANNLLRTENEWMRRMPKARGTKAKYRIDNFHKLKETADQRIDDSKMELDIKSRRMGSKVLEIYNISKKFDDKLLFSNFSYKFAPGEKIGIVGSNGSGKSTFLNIITGAMPPDTGHLELGETVVFGYYSQMGINLDNDKRIIEVIKEIAEFITLGSGRQMSALQFLEYFQFPADKHYNYVSKLSGGEKRRLYLMTVLMRNPNFLILDEPTNDLDIMTLNVLEDYLSGFKGCLLIVSHDRYFMDKVVEELFVFEDNGIRLFPGIYSDYRYDMEQREKEKRKEEQEKKPKMSKPKPKNQVQKISFKEKKALEQLETELEQLNQQKTELETAINSGSLPPDQLVEQSQVLGKLLENLGEVEMRWLELTEKYNL